MTENTNAFPFFFSSKSLRKRTASKIIGRAELLQLSPYIDLANGSFDCRTVCALGFATQTPWTVFEGKRLVSYSGSGCFWLDVITIHGQGEIYDGAFEHKKSLNELLLFPGCGSPESVVSGVGKAVFTLEVNLPDESFFAVPEDVAFELPHRYSSFEIDVSATFNSWHSVLGFDRYLPLDWHDKQNHVFEKLKRKIGLQGCVSGLQHHERVYLEQARSFGPSIGLNFPCLVEGKGLRASAAVIELQSTLGDMQFKGVLHLLLPADSTAIGEFQAFSVYKGNRQNVFSGRVR